MDVGGKRKPEGYGDQEPRSQKRGRVNDVSVLFAEYCTTKHRRQDVDTDNALWSGEMRARAPAVEIWDGEHWCVVGERNAGWWTKEWMEGDNNGCIAAGRIRMC